MKKLKNFKRHISHYVTGRHKHQHIYLFFALKND